MDIDANEDEYKAQSEKCYKGMNNYNEFKLALAEFLALDYEQAVRDKWQGKGSLRLRKAIGHIQKLAVPAKRDLMTKDKEARKPKNVENK